MVAPGANSMGRPMMTWPPTAPAPESCQGREKAPGAARSRWRGCSRQAVPANQRPLRGRCGDVVIGSSNCPKGACCGKLCVDLTCEVKAVVLSPGVVSDAGREPVPQGEGVVPDPVVFRQSQRW